MLGLKFGEKSAQLEIARPPPDHQRALDCSEQRTRMPNVAMSDPYRNREERPGVLDIGRRPLTFCPVKPLLRKEINLVGRPDDGPGVELVEHVLREVDSRQGPEERIEA